jgi:PAS domain S-box-containing protein
MPFATAPGAPPLGIVVASDVTELRSTLAEVQETRRLIDQIAATIPDIIYVYDLREKRNIYVNREIAQMLGYTPDAIQAMGSSLFTALLHPDDLPRVLAHQAMYDSLPDGAVVEIAYRMRHQDGTWRWLFSRESVFLRDADGRAVRTLGIAQDVTERKRMEAALAEQHEELERFFDVALDLWCIASTEGRFLRLSRMWEETLGYTRAELEGARFLDLVHPDDVQPTLDALARLDAQHTILNFTNRYRCKDGSYRHIEWRSQPYGRLIYAAARDVTARTAQAAHHAFLASIIDSSPDAIIAWSLDGAITAWNPGAQAIYGWTGAEMIGQSITVLAPPERVAEIREQQQRLQQGEPTVRFETMRVRRDGTRFDVAATMAPIRAADGTLIGITSLHQDITQLKQVQDALRHSEAQHRAIVTTMSEGIVMQGSDGSIQMCNAAAERILGLTADQMMGRTSIDPRWRSIHENGAPFPGELHPAMVALRSGQPVSNVIMGIHKPDDTLTWILINSQPLFHTDAAQPYAVVTSFTDITPLRTMELALQQSEQRLRGIFETLQDCVWSVKATDYSVDYLNPATQQIFGRPLADFYANPRLWIEMTHPDDRALVEQANAIVLERGHYEWEFRIVRPDGEVRWIADRAWLVRDADDQPLRLEGILSDNTERRLVQQQAAELAMERERVKLLNAFITNTSHELRTPLAIISTGVYLMKRLDDAAKRHERGALIETQIQALNTLIGQLHDMARLDQITDLPTIPVRVAELVEELMRTYQPKRATIRVEAQFADGLPRIEGDPSYIRTALLHLLDNAERFAPDDSIVRVCVEAADGWVVVSVHDAGPGIAAEHRQRIFEHFYKADEARTRTGQGAGMGLAFVRQIMKLHGGRVQVESEPGSGTTFQLWFPAPAAR